MRRRLRVRPALSAFGAISCVCMFSLPLSGSAQAKSSDTPTSTGVDAITNLLGCIASHQQIEMVVLLDESKSLEKTDKNGLRVELGKSIVASLNAVAQIPVDGSPARYDVVVAGFGSAVTNPDGNSISDRDWVTVDSTTVNSVFGTIDLFGGRASDDDTDYVDALKGAQELLSQHAAAMNPAEPETVCRAVAWFTDGEFDLTRGGLRRWWAQDLSLKTASSTAAAEARGVSLLCDNEGVADQLRTSNTYLLTFALRSQGFGGEEESLLKRVTLGEPQCGSSAAAGKGQYFAGSAVGELVCSYLGALTGRACGDESGTPRPDTCSVAVPCRQPINVDSTIGSFTAVVSAIPGLDATTLISPSGITIPLGGSETSAEADGATISLSRSSSTVFATAVVPVGAPLAVGTWFVQHAPPEGGALTVDLQFTAGFDLQVLTPSSIQRGRSATVTMRLLSRNGSPISSNELSSTPNWNIKVMDGANETSPTVRSTGDPSSFEFDVAAAAGSDAPSVAVSISGAAQTAQGTPVSIGPKSLSLPVALPGVPHPPDRVRLGVIRALRDQRRNDANLQPVLPYDERLAGPEFIGDPASDGQVCLESITVDPNSSTGVEVKAASPCVAVLAGSTTAFPLQLRIANPAAGPIAGTARFVLKASPQDLQQVVSIPLDGSVVVPLPDPYLDTTTLWWLFAIAVAIPLIAYIAFAWWTACFKDPQLVIAIEREVEASTTGLQLVGGPAGDEGQLEKIRYLTTRRQFSRTAAGPGVKFRAPIRLLRLPEAIAFADPAMGAAIAPKGGALTTWARWISKRPSGGRLEHQLQNQWVFLPATATDRTVTGRVILLLAGEQTGPLGVGPSEAIEQLMDAANDGIRTQWEAIRQSVTTPKSTSGKGPNSDPLASGSSTRYSSRNSSGRKP